MSPTPQGSDGSRCDGSSDGAKESLPAAVDRAIAESNRELTKAKKIRETQRLKLDEILQKLRKGT